MVKTGILALTLAVAAGVSAANAQGFSFGFGDPYADPYYRPYPPRYYQGPVVVVPRQAPMPRVQVVAPEEVRGNLQASGFSDISRIRARGAVYEMTAVDPDGNLVALAVSMYSGRIEGMNVLQADYARRSVPERAPVIRRAEPIEPAPPTRRAAPAEPAPAKVAAAPKPKPKTVTVPQPGEAPQAAAPATQPAPPAAEAPAQQPLASDGRDPLVVY